MGGGVGDAVVVEVAFVGIFLAFVEGVIDPFGPVALSGQALDAEEVAVVVPSVADRSLRAGYEEVVGGAVSAGAGEDESEFGGAELEAEFGPFSSEFGVRGVLAAIAHV